MTQKLIKFVTIADTAFAIAQDPDGAIRVAISGHLLSGNRDTLKTLLFEQLDRGARAFVLDLVRCGYIDSSGLGVIVSLSRKIAAVDGTFRLEGLNEDLVTLFELTKLDRFLTFTAAAPKENRHA